MTQSELRLLVVYPYAHLDFNPTMTLLLEALAERGIRVDVLMDSGEGLAEPAPFGPNVRLMRFPLAFQTARGAAPLAALKRLLVRAVAPRRYPEGYAPSTDLGLFALLRAGRYAAVIGADPYGIALADGLNRWARRPLVYLNFEVFPAREARTEEDHALKGLEQAACGRVARLLIQDAERARLFREDIDFPLERMAFVPVAPPPQEVPRSGYLREHLGIPASQRIVLYPGYLSGRFGMTEIEEMVSSWPEEFCLVLHSYQWADAPELSSRMRELIRAGRVYLSGTPVSRKALPSLVASADYGLIPYNPERNHWTSGDNLYHLGLSCGKAGYFAQCGLPMLARSLPVWETEFRTYWCGRVYHDPKVTGEILREMERDYTLFSTEARRFYRERLNPVSPMARFCDEVLDLVPLPRPETQRPRPVRVRTAEATR